MASIRRLTLDKFLQLDRTSQQEIFDVMKADYDVVKDLIRDRDEYARGYRKLYRQLEQNGIKPNTESYLRGI